MIELYFVKLQFMVVNKGTITIAFFYQYSFNISLFYILYLYICYYISSHLYTFFIDVPYSEGFKAGIRVGAPKLGAQKSFLVQYILSSIHSD